MTEPKNVTSMSGEFWQAIRPSGITDSGMAYKSMIKGLLPFHKNHEHKKQSISYDLPTDYRHAYAADPATYYLLASSEEMQIVSIQ